MRKTGTLAPLWPCGLVSVSAKRAFLTVPLHSPVSSGLRYARQGPYWDFHPSGSFLLLQKRAFPKAPSLHPRYRTSSLLRASPTPSRVPSSPRVALPAPAWLPLLLRGSLDSRVPL